MKTLTIKTPNNEIQSVILVNRIDKNIFACKSTSKKRNADLFVHIDYILSNVSDIIFETAIYNDCKINSDEFDGLCQANQIGENPFKCTIISR